MSKLLAGVLAVLITALLFAGCGGGSSPAPSSDTEAPTTTTAKSVVSSFCGAIKTNFPSDYDQAKSDFMQGLINRNPNLPDRGHIFFVWSDASITETAEICTR